MTRAARALLRADWGLREAIALRDPIAIACSTRDFEQAARRVARQERGQDRV